MVPSLADEKLGKSGGGTKTPRKLPIMKTKILSINKDCKINKRKRGQYSITL